jgi:hypothetical protein
VIREGGKGLFCEVAWIACGRVLEGLLAIKLKKWNGEQNSSKSKQLIIKGGGNVHRSLSMASSVQEATSEQAPLCARRKERTGASTCTCTSS